jgi:hypothetical protein
MVTITRLSLASLFIALPVSLIGCGSDDPATSSMADTGAAADTGVAADTAMPDTGTAGDGGGDATPADTKAHLRVAHLSPDAPAVKVCVMAKSASFSAADKPATPKLSFKDISVYLEVPPGTYKARLVADTAADCATSLAGLPDIDLPEVMAGQFATAAAIGKLADTGKATAFKVTAFFDLLATPAAGKAHLKFFHAAPTTNIPVFVGVASADGKKLAAAIFSNVAFGQSDAALSATNGYSPLAIGDTKVQLGAAGSAMGDTVWTSSAIKATGLPDQAIRSTFAIDAAGASTAGQVEVIACDDTDKGTGGLNKSCVVLPKG